MNATITAVGMVTTFALGVAAQPQAVTAEQNWTLLGVIALTVSGLIGLLYKMSRSMDRLVAALGKYSAAVQSVARETQETGREVRAQAENYDRKRDQAVRDVKDSIDANGRAIESLPERVAEELERRRGKAG
jgi:hypothetical protein